MTILTASTQLISVPPTVGRTFADVVEHSSSSPAGFSAISSFLNCPERSRLRGAGVRRKAWMNNPGDDFELNALDLGTLIHELARIRCWYGHEVANQQLYAWAPELGASFAKAALMIAMYEQTFPQSQESLRFLGVECEVVTNIRMGPDDPRPCLRTVRYDGVVQASGGPGTAPEIYSLERKTAARSGGTTSHTPQAAIQVALWNSNAEIVAQFGPMRGVIIEQWVKTKNPSVDRLPMYISPEAQRLALEYLRYPENGGVVFQMKPDGSYPKMLHACWGKYSPCDMISWCWEGVTGDFTKDGEEWDGE